MPQILNFIIICDEKPLYCCIKLKKKRCKLKLYNSDIYYTLFTLTQLFFLVCLKAQFNSKLFSSDIFCHSKLLLKLLLLSQVLQVRPVRFSLQQRNSNMLLLFLLIPRIVLRERTLEVPLHH